MPFDIVDCAEIVGVDDAGCAECAEDLGEEVDGEALPGEFAEEAEAESYGGVEEASRVASDIYAEHDAETPSPTYTLIWSESIPTWSSSLSCAEQNLCYAAIAKEYHDEGPQKFSKWLPK